MSTLLKLKEAQRMPTEEARVIALEIAKTHRLFKKRPGHIMTLDHEPGSKYYPRDTDVKYSINLMIAAFKRSANLRRGKQMDRG